VRRRADPFGKLLCETLEPSPTGATIVLPGTRRRPVGRPGLAGRARAIGPRPALPVADRGPGLPAGGREGGLFASIARREAGGAGGLGLAIVATFVEVHGQRVWVEARDGGGSRVCFTLPVAG
jgi:nitrogen-specific signal transduction histidine kinase